MLWTYTGDRRDQRPGTWGQWLFCILLCRSWTLRKVDEHQGVEFYGSLKKIAPITVNCEDIGLHLH